MFFIHLLLPSVMKRTASILTLLTLLIPLGFNYLIAQTNNEDFTIYLIRHAEKDLLSENQTNPPLTKCGVKRSDFFKDLFQETEIEKIYSTNYSRTRFYSNGKGHKCKWKLFYSNGGIDNSKWMVFYSNGI